jgi:hypothetical protein
MRRLMLVTTFVAAACGFPEPDGPTPDGAVDPGTTLVGAITTGGGVLESGALSIVDDGLELADSSCAGDSCVWGGLTP